MVMFSCLLCLLLAVFIDGKTFRAAVYEHALHAPNTSFVATRAQALEFMETNLRDYDVHATIASSQNADILVTPEDGIYGYKFTRETVRPYLETIPDPTKVSWSPCDAPSDVPNIEVQRRLSCMAKKHNLYLVANQGDLQPCSIKTDPKCPSDGHYQYNTNVVFAPNGTLIARYHKRHLFYEFQFDQPAPENIIFETPFGRFTVFTCFDILFEKPAITNIEKMQAANVVFPTAWMDALPLLAAVQFHSAFAMGMGVNYLASNLHIPDSRFQGSGVYTPTGAASFYYNATTGGGGGKVLVSDIQVLDRPLFEPSMPNRGMNQMPANSPVEFRSSVFHDIFNFVEVKENQAQLKVCHNRLCCHVKYRASLNSSDLYAFGAFDGLHTYEGQYYFQICLLIRCANASRGSCGAPTLTANSVFPEVELWGTFSTPYIFPEVTMSENGGLSLAKTQLRFSKKKLTTKGELTQPLLVASLFGRRYDWDDYTGNPTNSGEAVSASVTFRSLSIFAIFFIFY